MALERVLSEFSYRSGNGSQFYYFTVGIDQSGNASVRDIRTPTGGLCNTRALLPQTVLDDINAAIAQVEDILAQTSPINGFATFTAATSYDVNFATPLSGIGYRVVFTKEEFIDVRVAPGSKTVNGFTIEVSTTYTGTVGYDVFV